MSVKLRRRDMSKFLKIIFLGISLFSCFTAMAATLEDEYEEITWNSSFDEVEDVLVCQLICL
jgi:hypothetical protein